MLEPPTFTISFQGMCWPIRFDPLTRSIDKIGTVQGTDPSNNPTFVGARNLRSQHVADILVFYDRVFVAETKEHIDHNHAK